MSRTHCGSKGPDYDFWSRRPHSGAGYGREVKKRTHRTERREAAIALLDEWLADESGYDEATWPRLKASIERNRLSSRRRFGDTPADDSREANCGERV